MEKQKVIIKQKGKITTLSVTDILCCKADGNYTNIYLKNNKQIVLSKSLCKLQESLPKNIFFRCHKSFLVNTNEIYEIGLKKYEVILSNGKSINFSYRKRHCFLQKMYDSGFINITN